MKILSLKQGGHGHIDDEQLQISHSGYEEERFGNVIGSFEPIYHGPPSFTHVNNKLILLSLSVK